MPNFSSLAGLEVAEKFVVVGWGGWVGNTWLLCLTQTHRHTDNIENNIKDSIKNKIRDNIKNKIKEYMKNEISASPKRPQYDGL